MSSVNLFLLALSVGLSIALYQKSRADPKHTSSSSSSSSSSSGASSKKSNKKKKKNKTQTVDDKRVSKPTSALAPAPKPAPVDQNKEETKASQSQDEADPATTANEAIRAKHNASSAALHDHLDDMRDEEVDPTPKYSHVARIPAPAPAGPRSVKLTASDIEDGWESVSTRERSKNKSVPSSSAGNSFANVASTNPFSALESKPQPVSSSWVPAKSAKSGSTASTASASASSSSAPTKKQRQNAAKTAAKRAAKEADEQERLDRLARHRREQEREKARQATPKAPTPFTVKKATPASGPRASLNERGALVWE